MNTQTRTTLEAKILYKIPTDPRILHWSKTYYDTHLTVMDWLVARVTEDLMKERDQDTITIISVRVTQTTEIVASDDPKYMGFSKC